ncbi:hypothetical protein A2567_01785 [Candidatus Azambacteria bacterium RIFOXYD1_FULL_42_11]|uniref:Uncharacterized protein n=2 Tax=Candidatus Azamiibacteriota TaxID=1752741 RepID=A0A1F5CH27_9BACT|nr:MAG: hypothetical protein A2567_01785 [Candidatus Azambacteria bacterium RIFOXYD1_FULL_42_11]
MESMKRINWLFVSFILAPILGFVLILSLLTHSFNASKGTELNYANDKLYVGFKMDLPEPDLVSFEKVYGLKRLELNDRPLKNLKVGYYEIISGKKAVVLKNELAQKPIALFVDLKVIFPKQEK